MPRGRRPLRPHFRLHQRNPPIPSFAMPLPCLLRPIVAGALLALPFAFLRAADFQVITVRGTVTSVSGAWNSTVVAGTTFVLTTQVDLAAPDRDPSATGGKFETSAAPFSFLVGDYTFSTTGTTIEITNGATEDGYEFENDSRFTVNGFNNIKVKTRLESNNVALLSSTALPVQQFPATAFDNKRTIEFRSDNGQLDGRIDSYAVTGLTQTAPATTRRLINLSTRGKVEAGDDRMIAGFVIQGADTKRVLIRALGPSLSASRVANPLANPSFQVFNSAGQLVGGNDDWQADAAAAEIQSLGLAPTNANEAASILTLPAGPFTAVISSANNVPGTALVEVYELP